MLCNVGLKTPHVSALAPKGPRPKGLNSKYMAPGPSATQLRAFVVDSQNA